jgi:hypothetical protein
MPRRAAALAAAIALASAPAIPARGDPSPSAPSFPRAIQAVGGVIVPVPQGWAAATARGRAIVTIAAPPRGPARPALTVLIQRSGDPASSLIDSVSRGLGSSAPLALLGERRPAGDRVARYYLRGTGEATEYVLAGVISRSGWAVVVIGIDIATDPQLQQVAQTFHAVFTAISVPG